MIPAALPDEIGTRYHVTGQQPVVFLLSAMVRDGVGFSVHFGDDMFLTTLLAVQPEHGRLIFDCSGSEASNKRLLRSERSVFVARPGGIQVQFPAGPVSELIYGGARAFSVALPRYVVRLQRRECFRIELSRLHPVELFARLPDQTLLRQPIHDLSVSGCGLELSEMPAALNLGVRLGNCHCTLPGDERDIFFAAIVRHVTELASRSGSRHWRVGLQFEGLPAANEMHIQRCIVRIERERHELS